MKEHIYSLNDTQIVEKAKIAAAEQKDKGFIGAIRKSAKAETRRVATKAQRITERIMTQIPDEQREELSDNVSELVKKRERSRAGLASYLIGKEFIRPEHVQSDGSLDIDALQQTTYFQKNQHFLEALATYQLSKKSKLRQKGTEKMHHQDRSVSTPVLVDTERAERIRQKLHPQKETLFKRMKDKIETKREEWRKKPKRKRLVKAGIGAAGVAMAAGLAISCTSENNDPPTIDRPTVTPNPLPKETKEEPKKPETQKPPEEKEKEKEKVRTYVVKKNDNLSDIAERYYGKELWKPIYEANKTQIKDPDLIYPEQKLTIPQKNTPEDQTKPHTPKKIIKYEVNKGDTLSELAQKFKTDIPSIMEKNKKIKDEDVIFAGDTIKIPVKKQHDNPTTNHGKFDSSHWKNFVQKQSVHGNNWVEFLQSAKKVAKEENYPLSVLVGQAAIETGRGKSEFAVQRNNFFGYNAYDSNPGAAVSYQSKEASIKHYIELIRESPRYQQAYANKEDPKKMVQLIKQGGYATDPHYVEKVTNTNEFKTLQKMEKS